MKKKIIVSILSIVFVAYALSFITTVSSLKSDLEILKGQAEKGAVAFDCINQGECVYQTVTQYHQFKEKQSLGSQGASEGQVPKDLHTAND